MGIVITNRGATLPFDEKYFDSQARMHFVCDTTEDFMSLDSAECAPGSEVYVIATGETYILDSASNWQLKAGSTKQITVYKHVDDIIQDQEEAYYHVAGADPTWPLGTILIPVDEPGAIYMWDPDVGLGVAYKWA